MVKFASMRFTLIIFSIIASVFTTLAGHANTAKRDVPTVERPLVRLHLYEEIKGLDQEVDAIVLDTPLNKSEDQEGEEKQAVTSRP